ncbi:MAG: PEP-CTERM sorting domain-containing protein [Pseudomonadota bacterium]
MLKKSLLLLALLTLSHNTFATLFTNKAAWEAAANGVIQAEPEFGGCVGTVGVQTCTYYPTGIFTDTKVVGQAYSFIQFNTPSGSHGDFSAIGFNVDTSGNDIGGKLAFTLGYGEPTYFLPASFSGGFLGMVEDHLVDGNSIKILPQSSTPVTFTLSNFQTAALVTPAPEPETYAMMLTGLGLVGLSARRKKKLS